VSLSVVSYLCKESFGPLRGVHSKKNNMDAVSCSCAKCDEYIGDFENQWNKLGKGHFSPVNLRQKDWNIGLTVSEVVRIAPLDSVIEDR
jgi:hypothetical protein